MAKRGAYGPRKMALQCANCGDVFPRQDTIRVGKIYYCQGCYEERDGAAVETQEHMDSPRELGVDGTSKPEGNSCGAPCHTKSRSITVGHATGGSVRGTTSSKSRKRVRNGAKGGQLHLNF